MAMAMMTWLIAIPLLGVVTGMRSMTAMAVLCWFAYGGDLPLDEALKTFERGVALTRNNGGPS